VTYHPRWVSSKNIMLDKEENGWQLVRIKRWWIPGWAFSLAVHWCRFLESDMAEFPYLRMLFTTDAFHFHDVGRPIHGKSCRRCHSAK
jgi:hypothetical protein